MVLFVSDMHFGQHDAARERAKEADLVACLRAHEADVERLYLVGDVFDGYIEYRHLVPKGYVRFQALLASWTDRGVPVTYLVGNHDPWHRGYFEAELGVRVVFDSLVEPLYGTDVYMAHGDGLASGGSLYHHLKPWLRHPVPVWLYRTLLPGDLGMALARRVAGRIRGELNDRTIEGLRAFARRTLAETTAGIAVMGHSHRAELHAWPEGVYLNTGCWYQSRTFGRLDGESLSLLRWNGTCSETLSRHRGKWEMENGKQDMGV